MQHILWLDKVIQVSIFACIFSVVWVSFQIEHNDWIENAVVAALNAELWVL